MRKCIKCDCELCDKKICHGNNPHNCRCNCHKVQLTKKERSLAIKCFNKLSTFLDMCHGTYGQKFTFDEIMSIFISNFERDEIIALRKAQHIKNKL